MLVPEPRRYLPQLEDALVAQVVIEEEARRPTRRVRKQRPVELKAFLVAVGVARIERVEIPVGSEEGGMQKFDRMRAPLDAALGPDIESAAAAEEILLRDVDVVRRLAAFVREIACDVGRPRVLRGDDDVD